MRTSCGTDPIGRRSSPVVPRACGPSYAQPVRHLALSALGRDRPGIVAAVTAALLRHELNVEDSQMTILRGHFTMVLVLGAPDSLDVAALGGELQEVGRELGLEAVSLAEVTDAGGAHPEPTHIIAVYGADHPGIASIAVRLSVPSSTNRGRTRCEGLNSVSRTMSRSSPVRRSRRIRVAGKAICQV